MEWKSQKELKAKYMQNKPVEMYVFVDPFCMDCWMLSPIVKKLQIQYGDYFTIKHVLAGDLTALNSCKLNNRKEQLTNSSTPSKKMKHMPHLAAISIKAAELQGKRAGIRYLRRLQELLFMEQEDITDLYVLEQCADHVGLDCKEFLRDLYSSSAARAFQCDVIIATEMNVAEMPAIVFFNERIEDEGLKISGLYSYDIYVHILTEMLGGYVQPTELPPLELYLSANPMISTQDLAMIYDMPFQTIERKMKKLQLQRRVKRIQTQNGSYWKYIAYEQ
ncbi:ClpXP adapter SpxH family protein [Siminovitchia sp. FSL H7-0308]|uniref:ClpXP adapter protein SpxH n=1 Tax=Siminovitchia thermophila TaxID=1245522 RepID=A0ABS2RCH6_9BACI|nr:ClpXP adapter SpxH family protein [Siminovitchia thermophila]MBM7717357.1 putative DsbA family dithiol-disulfide isomerase [Siminovitchia thermophila]ONK24398.1 dithiol-disulfide isomerase [Bacillus sp. VT-16-64]